MYSKNDYLYYLENQLEHSDDYLAHYGIKGMKWKNHKTPSLNDAMFNNPNAVKTILTEQERGMKRTNQMKVRAEQARGKTRTDNVRRNTTPINTPKKKKKSLKGRISSFRKKYGLYREKPKGKNIGNGIYVTHN